MWTFSLHGHSSGMLSPVWFQCHDGVVSHSLTRLVFKETLSRTGVYQITLRNGAKYQDRNTPITSRLPPLLMAPIPYGAGRDLMPQSGIIVSGNSRKQKGPVPDCAEIGYRVNQGRGGTKANLTRRRWNPRCTAQRSRPSRFSKSCPKARNSRNSHSREGFF